MSSMKRRARDHGSGQFVEQAPKKKRGRPKKFEPDAIPESINEPSGSKHKVGRPRAAQKSDQSPLPTFEVSITVSVGGADIDRTLLLNMQQFLVERTHAGKCTLERGGTAFHLHLQMVARLQAKTLISISRLVKTYLGWDTAQPAGGMVRCRKLVNKGLHTFHGMIGYCMKDACEDHFETVDHNVSAEDINLGLEQYALHGQEENKNRIVLTMQNIVDHVFMWRKCNCKHPLVIDFSRDIFDMLKTGKYYPAPTWVIGGYGKGYEPYRMQSLYKIMVTPLEITRQDVANVFEIHDNYRLLDVPRKEWFADHWKGEALSQ